jgi:hypothetical protein
VDDAMAWDGNWAWSFPLIILTVILHVLGLGYINAKVVQALTVVRDHRAFVSIFAFVLSITILLATLLHGIEAGIWAAAYRAVGAIPNNRLALLYSLNAITTYGHSEVRLADHWRLMGALEALNGMLLFGLTTAFLYGVIQRVWPVEHREFTPPRMPWSRRRPDLAYAAQASDLAATVAGDGNALASAQPQSPTAK